MIGLAAVVSAKPLDVVGDDDASRYVGSGWSTGKSDGTGFGRWVMQTITTGGDSHAGSYVADAGEKPDLNAVAIRGKAFGLYANGTGFEESTAFRAFDKPLQVGQSFSFLMEHGEFVKKSDTDPGGGSVGITLREGNATGSAEDYNKGMRFEFGYYQKEKKYIIYDGDGTMSLDIPFTDAGLAVTFTLVTPDTYNLEITTMADKKTMRLNGKKLGGTPGASIGSFCLFDRNGETNDLYFNGFQILQAPE